MKSHTFRSWAAALACLGILTPQAALAAAPGQAAVGGAADVALAEGGVLTGQVVDAAGVPMPQAPVAVLVQGREVVRVAAGADGAFAIGGLKGGVYEVAAPGHRGVYRLWAPRTAPPSATQGVMLVPAGEVVRGQYGYPPAPPCPPQGPFGKAMGWVSDHPFITAGIVATAVAVPLAVAESDDDNDPPPGS
jgi:hypothetical protein